MSQLASFMSQITTCVNEVKFCCMQSLSSASKCLSSKSIERVQKEFQTAHETKEKVINFLKNYITTLVSVINASVSINDYKNLEMAVQKSEADIRKHICLEQQLKIYMDDLEQKNEQLEKELRSSQMKYEQLFQSMKNLHAENKELERKMKGYESRPKNYEKIQKKSKIISDISIYESQTHSNKLLDQSKIKNNFIQGRKITKKSQSRLDNANLIQSPKKRIQTENSQLKELTKTIQLKEGYRKPSRKLMVKHKNENKKEIRSNSVFQ